MLTESQDISCTPLLNIPEQLSQLQPAPTSGGIPLCWYTPHQPIGRWMIYLYIPTHTLATQWTLYNQDPLCLQTLYKWTASLFPVLPLNPSRLHKHKCKLNIGPNQNTWKNRHKQWLYWLEEIMSKHQHCFKNIFNQKTNIVTPQTSDPTTASMNIPMQWKHTKNRLKNYLWPGNGGTSL